MRQLYFITKKHTVSIDGVKTNLIWGGEVCFVLLKQIHKWKVFVFYGGTLAFGEGKGI